MTRASVSGFVLPLATLIAAALAPSAAGAATPPTVVVSPFVVDGAADYAWLSSALAQRLTERLTAEPSVSVFSQKQWAAVLRQRDIAAPQVRGQVDAGRVARQLGAEQYVYGHVTARWPHVRLFGRRVDAKSGEVIAEASVEGPLADIVKHEQALAEKLFADEKTAKKKRKDKANPTSLHAYTLCRDALFSTSLRKGAARPEPASILAIEPQCISAAKSLKTPAAKALTTLTAFFLADPKANALTKAEKKLVKSATKTLDPTSIIVADYILAERKRPQDGEKLLKTVLKKRPGFLHAHLLLAEDLLAQGDEKGANAILSGTLVRAPSQPWAKVLLGKIKAKRGEHDLAISLTDEAIKETDGDAVYLMEKASRLIDAKRFKLAEPVLRDALKADPRLAKAYVRLGYVYLQTGQNTLAGPVLKKALYEADRVSERRVVAYANFDLAKLALRQNDSKGAMTFARRAVQAGFSQRARYAEDEDLKGLLSDKAFSALLSAP